MLSNKRLFGELGKDMVVYGLMEGVSRMIGLLLLPIFTRVLATDEYGTLDIVLTATNLIAVFASLSLPTGLQRYYGLYKGEDRRKLVTSSFVLVFGACVVILGIGWSLSPWLAEVLLENQAQSNFIRLGMASAILSSLAWIPQAALRVKREILKFNLTNFVYSILYALFSVYLVFGRSLGLLGILYASVAASIFQLLLSLFLVRHTLGFSVSLELMRRMLTFSIPLIPSVAITWVNKQADRFVLLSYMGLSVVGIFAAAARLSGIIELFTSIFQKSWNPFAYSIIDNPVKDRDLFYRRAMDYFTVVSLTLGLGLIAISPEIFHLLVPPDYWPGIVLVPWIVGASLLHVSGVITGIGIVVSEKMLPNTLAAWVGALLNVGLAILLIQRWGLEGASIGRYFAAIVRTAILIYFTHKLSSVRFNLRVLLLNLFLFSFGSEAMLVINNFASTSAASLFVRLVVFFVATAVSVQVTIGISNFFSQVKTRLSKVSQA
jgi:O-antigen/teichoic acid export membrane protein